MKVFCLIGVGLCMLSSTALAGSLRVTATTRTYDGREAPKNLVAVWMQNASGQFVKTIGIWAAERKNDLVSWKAASSMDVDGLTGATRNVHGTISATWNLTNQNGQRVANGTYRYCIEMTEDHSNSIDPPGPLVRGNIVIDGHSHSRTGYDSSANSGSTFLTNISVTVTDTTSSVINTIPGKPSLKARIAAKSGVLTLSLPAGAIGAPLALTICDLQGKIARRYLERSVSSAEKSVPVQGLKDGVYVAIAEFQGQLVRQPVLVMKR